jgi:hypothetical protein
MMNGEETEKPTRAITEQANAKELIQVLFYASSLGSGNDSPMRALSSKFDKLLEIQL